MSVWYKRLHKTQHASGHQYVSTSDITGDDWQLEYIVWQNISEHSIVFTASPSELRQCVLLVAKMYASTDFRLRVWSWPDLDPNDCEWCQPFHFSSQLCVYGICKITIGYFGQTVRCVKFNYANMCDFCARSQHNITKDHKNGLKWFRIAQTDCRCLPCLRLWDN